MEELSRFMEGESKYDVGGFFLKSCTSFESTHGTRTVLQLRDVADDIRNRK